MVPEPRGALAQCSTRNWAPPYAVLAPTPSLAPGLPARADAKCAVRMQHVNTYAVVHNMHLHVHDVKDSVYVDM